ncbi:MAG: hypothetical protein WDN31_18110 [Hyphomicrobium sp.]
MPVHADIVEGVGAIGMMRIELVRIDGVDPLEKPSRFIQAAGQLQQARLPIEGRGVLNRIVPERFARRALERVGDGAGIRISLLSN